MRLKHLFYSMALVAAIMPLGAQAQSGACGVSVTWELTGNTLTISGEGNMYDNYNVETFSYAIYSDQVEKVVINDGVTSVGDFAFTEFTNLTSVDLPSTITTIGAYSFSHTALASIEIPSSVVELKEYCFTSTNLTKVEVPSSVRVINDGIFSQCPNLREVYWDANILFENSYISSNIFFEDVIASIHFGPNVKNIPRYFMLGAGSGYEITSDGNIEYIGESAFVGSKWLAENITEEVLYFDKCLYSCGTGLNSPTHIEIKEGTIGLSSNAFENNNNLIGITIPESMSKIGWQPFNECSSLGKVVWNAVDCKVWGQTFDQNLSEITFGDKVIAIPESLCSNCTGLKSLAFPNSLRSIGINAFQYCDGIEKIEFNEQLDSIADGAFRDCKKLQAAHLTARIIERAAFSGCSNVKEVTFSNNVKRIGSYNFDGVKIDELILPSTLEYIEWIFMNGHIGKVVVECPDAENALGSAFVNTSGMEPAVINNMVFAEGVESCQSFNVVDSVTISKSVTRLSWGSCATLIYNATEAESSVSIECNYLTIGEGVKRIPASFVYGDKLTEVVFPLTVTEIGEYAFGSCGELTKVTAPWYDPREVTAADNVFGNPYPNEEATLYVPKGRIEAYKELAPWSNFKIIKEIDGSTEIDEVEAPTIAYENGSLLFSTTTPDAEYHYTISDPDIVSDQTSSGYVELNAYYEISVYASAPGLIDSRVTTARLYFIEANFESSDVLDVTVKRGVLVSTSGATLTVTGLSDNEAVEVYDLAGHLVGKANAIEGTCTLTVKSEESILLVRTATATIKVKR